MRLLFALAMFFLPSTSAVAESLPTSLVKQMQKDLPGFRVAEMGDLNRALRALLKELGGHPFRPIIRVDMNADQQPDYVVVAINKSKSIFGFYCFLHIADGYRTIRLLESKWVNTCVGIYRAIELKPKGNPGMSTNDYFCPEGARAPDWMFHLPAWLLSGEGCWRALEKEGRSAYQNRVVVEVTSGQSSDTATDCDLRSVVFCTTGYYFVGDKLRSTEVCD